MIEDKDNQLSVPERYFFYYSLFKKSPIGMGVADLNGELIDFNDAMMQPGGYTREDILEIKNVAKLYSDPQERQKALELAQSQGFLDRFPCHFRKKDGSSYATLMTLRPIEYEQKRFWLATVEVVTG